MQHIKLVHKNPKLNDKNLWYRVVGSNDHYYFATIWGPNGMINSQMHAVPAEDFTMETVKEQPALVAPAPVEKDDAADFM